ncbi:WRC domain [Dillenia turbinata]|uniref:Growth-regulating factor n=1 Tax=Dillenia turbinata TaxID=194707 RepID=A0AAN8UKB6_9MAGN
MDFRKGFRDDNCTNKGSKSRSGSRSYNRQRDAAIIRMMMMSARNKSPFTPSQWQELEHQALILKYIMSGMPVPPDLIFNLKTNLFDSSLFPLQQPIGWGCFPMGFGRKADPEPGRCRRTDGKKWRCSKVAFADSKYCERHMHRGKNRSRKPVELPSSSSTSCSSSSTTYSTTNSTSTCGAIKPPLPSSLNYETNAYPFLHSHSSPSTSRPPDSDFASRNNNTRHLFLDSASYFDRDYRHCNEVRNGVDEKAFFPVSESQTPLTISPTLVPSKHESFPVLHNGCAAFPLQSLSSNSKQQQEYQQSQQQQLCFIVGSDFKSVKENIEEVNQKPLHHFFRDWNTKNRETWIDFGEPNTSFAATQLSISIPVSTPELLSSHFKISNW